MTKAKREKAILVIKDVLKLIRRKGVRVLRHNVYLRNTGNDIDGKVSLQTQLNKLMSPSAPCEVCAKGALFLGYVDKFNRVKKAMPPYRVLNENVVAKPLTSIWPQSDLDQIEMVFEDGCVCVDGDLFTTPFASVYDGQERMEAILKYMLKNGGEFVVDPIWKKEEAEA